MYINKEIILTFEIFSGHQTFKMQIIPLQIMIALSQRQIWLLLLKCLQKEQPRLLVKYNILKMKRKKYSKKMRRKQAKYIHTYT